MPRNVEYVIAYFTAEGKFLGYYAEDSHSGGYPYISESTRQAVTMTEDRAMRTAEESFNFPYSNFDQVESCVVGKFEIPNAQVLRRSTYKDQRKQREIDERMNKIRELQREIAQLQESN